MQTKTKKRLIKILIILLILTGLYAGSFGLNFAKNKKIEYGVNFSQKYAQELDLDWREAYLAILEDLQVKKIRLIAHWDLIEKDWGIYDFSDLDWQIQQAEQFGTEIVLAIGHRVPRWPECHWPDWTANLSADDRNRRVILLLENIVKRYKDSPAIVAWQVENEPFLKVFGECPPPDENFYQYEVDLIRSLDNRPIVVTESGELSTWLKGSKFADYLGTSVYRITWNPIWGYFRYPLPPAYYYLKTQLVKLFRPDLKNVIVTEMQMEPWLPGTKMLYTPLEEQYRSMDLKQFNKNLKYSSRIGLTPVYFWGAEWWYWLKECGDDSFWQTAKQIFNN
ncbi:MAG: cellulase family glycosylhydrolase [Patescibacteria group bacterium]|nr:cellulase family glycosylhydrolase [Patescibacteria group bacterium]